MQPVRKVLSATHFKQVDEDGKMKWTPCSPGDMEAEERTWTDIDSDELLEPPLKIADFLKSLDSVRPTVSADDIKRHDQWTLESGKTKPYVYQCTDLSCRLALDRQRGRMTCKLTVFCNAE